MIVESMSLKEVYEQLMKDLPLLWEWAYWKVGYELRSKFAHSNVYPCYAFRTWRSPMTNIAWRVLFYCTEKKKAHAPVCRFYVKYDSANGKGAYYCEYMSKRYLLMKYISHFFARYRQRYIEPNHIDLSSFKYDIIDYYFLHNQDLFLCTYLLNEYFYGSDEQGTIFGIHEDELYYVVKTYINPETLSQKKKAKLDLLLRDGLKYFPTVTTENVANIAKNRNQWQVKWKLGEEKGK